MTVRIAEEPGSIKIAPSIPQCEFKMATIDLDINNIILEDCLGVHGRTDTLHESDQGISFPACRVSNNDQFPSHFGCLGI